MDMIIEFFKNFGQFFVSINVNAFWTLIYAIKQNWLIILAVIFIGILMYCEIKMKTEEIIDDKREIY